MNGSVAKKALLVGGTGLIGGHLLSKLLEQDAYRAVVTLGRRQPELQHQKLTHIVTDFDAELTQAADCLNGVDVLFCSLGTTIRRAGSKQAFRAIDHDLVLSVAKKAVASNATSMIVVSSVGADPESGNFYLRTKGEMERAIAQLGFERVGIVRPSLLLGAREEFRPAEQLGQYAARLINPFMAGGLARYRAVDAATVAAAMIGLDQTVFEGTRVIEGNEIPRLSAAP